MLFRNVFLAPTGAVLILGASLTTAAAQSPPAGPPPILPFDEALNRAATTLLSKAEVPGRTGKIPLVVDPLVDGNSGMQSNTTRGMEERLRALITKQFPNYELLPFNAASIDRNPVVMVGTFTAVNNAGQAQGPRDAYRICFALADLQSKTIVSKAATRANPQGIAHIPTAFFNEAPVMGKDAAIDAYVKTCQASKLKAPVDATFVANIKTDAYVSDAISAYDGGAYAKALDLYTKAKAATGGDQLRVLNGLYLSNWRLGKRKAASDAFAQVIDQGLKGDKLNVRFLFRPGTARFIPDPKISEQYPTWFARIAMAAVEKNACLEAVGHASKTGPEPFNKTLSKMRADRIRAGFVGYAKGIEKRVKTTGVGSSQAIIGTGRDDASDALDRRVEFKIVKC